jgi:phage-related baseplate assembly protein
MAFQLKDFTSIAASMVNYAKATQDKLTDFNIGSAARTMLESPAIEIEELYQQMWNGLNESIPIAVFNSFDFPALDARNSTGRVRIYVAPSVNPVTIAGGTVFTTTDSSSISFATITDAIIPGGSSFYDVNVVAVVAGYSGNIALGTDFIASPTIPGYVNAEAINGFVDGADAESLDDRKNRFVEYISTLSRGTTAALRYGAKTVQLLSPTGLVLEAVRQAVVIEPWLSDDLATPGLIYLYVYNGVGTASGTLLDQVSKVIDGYYDTNGKPVPGWKAAGVKVITASAVIVSVNVTATVTIDQNYDSAATLALVSAGIVSYLASLDIGADVILSEIVARAMQVDGVTNFRMTVPALDVAIAENAKAVAGTLAITEAP